MKEFIFRAFKMFAACRLLSPVLQYKIIFLFFDETLISFILFDIEYSGMFTLFFIAFKSNSNGSLTSMSNTLFLDKKSLKFFNLISFVVVVILISSI